MIKIIKRDGSIVDFDKNKIVIAIEKAMKDVGEIYPRISTDIAFKIKNLFSSIESNVDIETIQDLVEDSLIACGYVDVAKAYIKYRYSRNLVRETEKRNKSVLELLDLKNEELYDENSNKDVMLLSTMRDYMAGETSKELVSKLMFDKDLIEAHNQGIIHIHDTDYIAERITNCGLINLEDMLQNGTVISDTLIERPKSFMTACTITTQVIAQVASSQFGLKYLPN